jgi:hypothetical protein
MINTKTFIAKKVCESLYDNTGNNGSLLQFIERSQIPDTMQFVILSLEHYNGDKCIKEAIF